MNFKAQTLPAGYTQINTSLLTNCNSTQSSNCLVSVCDVKNLSTMDMSMINDTTAKNCTCKLVSDMLTTYNVTLPNGEIHYNDKIQKCSGAKSYKWKSSVLLLGLLAFFI
ncbi:hypothetical protein BB559_005225 [Furculomyces boomerangus]|uniref:Uncharacterized protein n=1 Tax=Furculomyces boomerangus TaxID=61424 RepID=A0A2T9Y9X8_9FUNG|nr:hypothetical protein BB559_005225 [Furculomyces boomerangus]